MKSKTLLRAGILALALAAAAFAGDRYLVRIAPESTEGIWRIAARHGGIVAKTFRTPASSNLFIVDLPSGVIAELRKEDGVKWAEPEQQAKLPLRNFHASGFRDIPPRLPDLSDPGRTFNFFGTPAWGPYLNQPASHIIGIPSAHRFATGAGIVAVIDTGVDVRHPVLAPALVSGWDFTRDIAGGSEEADLDQEVTPILDQEVTPILDGGGTVMLNQNAAVQEFQEVTPILDQRIPAALGHGTMTAGLIHLVAPTAKIMPLKAFRSDGTADISDVIDAIYWATDHGANIISMSFDAPEQSEELKLAIKYARSKGIVLVAAAGNDGAALVVYPAGYRSVMGVASTNNHDVRSSFSNYGDVVNLAAPGEAIVSTYPRNRYAMGWGTSFSAPLVSGAAALLLQMDPNAGPRKIWRALSQADSIRSFGMGSGRLDLVRACTYFSAQ